VNHVVSKQIVASAERTGRGIAIEDLTHIRRRVTARRPQRATLHSWAFRQLRGFLEYKAALVGVAVAIVDPRNSSRECSQCHHLSTANRPNQSTFRCQACGHASHADLNAAVNLRARGRAVVNPPNAAVGLSPTDPQSSRL
jgi:IS605 OrfB family transposase